MEPNPEELLSALHDAEEFISVTLSKESLTLETENKRSQLEMKLKNLVDRTKSGKGNRSPLPPRPPKSISNIPEEENNGQDLYDDVHTDAIEVKEERPDDGHNKDQTMSPSYFKIGIDGVSNESQDSSTTQENYEDMSTEDALQVDDTYDDTLNMGDSTSLTEEANYEVAEPENLSTDAGEKDLYEGVETPDDSEETDSKIDSVSSELQKRSTVIELGMLTNPIKAADVREVIYKGYLEKHRKKGKLYLGGKWQKRYCVVRSFVMYYFVNQNSDRQKGTIILPGYKVSINKPSKTGREFILTRDKDRSYIFQGESKEEVEKWINAIQKAANTKISNRQSEILNDLRSHVLDGDEDGTSINDDILEKSKNGSTNGGKNEGGEIYDDVNENDDSGSGSGSASIAEYEISEVSSKPAIEPGAKEQVGFEMEEPLVQDDIYEMPENEQQELSPPVQPPRPDKVEPPSMPVNPPDIPTAIEEELYDDVGVEVSPAKLAPPSVPGNLQDIPTTTEEEEELYDDVGVEAPPEPAKPKIPERNIPLPAPPSEYGKASSGMQRPALPSPPREPKQAAEKPSIPHRNGSLPPEPEIESTPNETSSTGKGPPPLPPEEEKTPDQAPEEEQIIDYANIYQALWDCKPDADDELEFNRGDLIYIYEKPHSDWWIGSKYRPQGYETRLIPKNYLTEAYS